MLERAALISLILLSTLAYTEESGATNPCSYHPTRINIEAVAEVNNAFNWKLIKVSSEEDNEVFSSVSISSVFEMLLAGAKGDTAKELRNTLHVDGINVSAIWSVMKNYLPEENSVAEFKIANRLFLDRQVTILDSFASLARNSFDSQIGTLNIRIDPDKARDTINAWVACHTKGTIVDLFPESSIDVSTQLVIVNAIYFKGNWSLPFSTKDTHESKFSLDGGGSVKCDMMWREGEFSVYFDDKIGAKIVKIPYAKEEFDFVAAIPDNRATTLSTLIKKMSRDVIMKWLKHHVKCKVALFLPKFRIEHSMNLKKTLRQLGVEMLFDSTRADLSGINGERGLFVKTAFHKAFIDVNEEGTVASAATGVGVTFVSAPINFRLDRPFLFLIVHRKTNVIIFSGKVRNPK